MTKIHTKTHAREPKPIRVIYDYKLATKLEHWARFCSFKPDSLRKASKKAVRTNHHKAFFIHESHEAHGNQPNIYTQTLRKRPSVYIHYTIEPHAIVIRGYAWRIVDEQLGAFIGGAIYGELHWG